jgi:hypothetical protein
MDGGGPSVELIVPVSEEAVGACVFYMPGRWEPGNHGIGIGRRRRSLFAASNLRLPEPVELKRLQWNSAMNYS